jgi:hypothetical protein
VSHDWIDAVVPHCSTEGSAAAISPGDIESSGD